MKKKQGIFIVGFAVLTVILAVSFIWVGDLSAKSSVRKAFFWRQMMGEDGRPLLRQYLFGRMKALQALRLEVQPRVEAELTKMKLEIKGLLTSEQILKWDEYVEEFRKRWSVPQNKEG